MQAWSAKLLHKEKLVIGEAAHWHNEWHKFLFVDIEGRKVGRIDPISGAVEEIILQKRVGTVVPSDNDQLILGLQGSIEMLDFESKILTELAKIESDKPGNRCNDGKCDAVGRFWIGTMDVDAKLNWGALYVYDGALKIRLDNVSISNGICWAADNKTMYYIDSYNYNIGAYDFDLLQGTISNYRTIVRMEAKGKLFDGMAIDLEGKLWVAVWGGGCVNRYDPDTGELIGQVRVDAPNVASCAFGGEGMEQLFITTARAGLSEDQLNEFPLSGSLFIVNTGIVGAGMHAFKSEQVGP